MPRTVAELLRYTWHVREARREFVKLLHSRGTSPNTVIADKYQILHRRTDKWTSLSLSVATA